MKTKQKHSRSSNSKHNGRPAVKKIGLGILVSMIMLAVNPTVAFAQDEEPPAWLKKMEADALKKMDSLQKDPAFKKMMQQAGPAGTTGKSGSLINIPLRKKALPDSLIKDTLTRSQYTRYLSNLQRQMESCLTPAQKKNIDNINPTILRNPKVLGLLSVLGWYRGGTVESGVIAVRAAAMDSASALEANNLSAILIMGGLSEKAIPILRHHLRKYPDDPLLLNNLGQAYAGLGVPDSALIFLQRCLQKVPTHPEANNTLAHLQAAKGNDEAAIRYAEKSLEGGYNNSAFHLWIKLKPKPSKFHLLLQKIDLPGDFNAYKYELPRQQLLIDEGPEIEEEHYAFREALDGAIEQVNLLSEQYGEKGKAIMEARVRSLQRDPLSFNKNPNAFMRPLTLMASMMLQRYGMSDMDDSLDSRLQGRMDEVWKKFELKRASIIEEYARRMKGIECGEGNAAGCRRLDVLAKERCRKMDEATMEYLAAKATIRIDWQTKKKNLALKSFFLFSKLNYFAAPEKNLAIAAYYKEAATYLTKIKSYVVFDQAHASYCNPSVERHKREKKFAFDFTADCPFELEIPMIVGKLGLNCEEASFSISAGATFKFTQNFASRQSTLSIGIGLGVEHSIEAGGAEAKVGANIGQSIFITVDGSGKLHDAGMQFGMGVSAGYGVKAGVRDEGGETVAEMARNFGEKKYDVGYRFGINSGLEFNEGPLKSLLERKPEKQLNPKVQIYKK